MLKSSLSPEWSSTPSRSCFRLPRATQHCCRPESQTGRGRGFLGKPSLMVLSVERVPVRHMRALQISCFSPADPCAPSYRTHIICCTPNAAYSTAIRKLDADEGKGAWDEAAERAKLCESLTALDSALSAASPGCPSSLSGARSFLNPCLYHIFISFTAACCFSLPLSPCQ